ncbi:hypothetical protein D4R89_02725 [bacterium]|nr:MAG: hypothetical protein D4R89_02725 [bacterium]
MSWRPRFLRPGTGRLSFDEQEHESAEGQGAGRHDSEERQSVADAGLLVREADGARTSDTKKA